MYAGKQTDTQTRMQSEYLTIHFSISAFSAEDAPLLFFMQFGLEHLPRRDHLHVLGTCLRWCSGPCLPMAVSWHYSQLATQAALSSAAAV